MPKIYQQASIVCLPSYREGMPKALLEGASCAKPLVAFDVPGCREVVQHMKTGLIVTPKDSKALASALLELIHTADMREQLGNNARKLVKEKFSQAVINKKTFALWKEVGCKIETSD
jgi:glycosyltransferase involved in cell wall biosynthesis